MHAGLKWRELPGYEGGAPSFPAAAIKGANLFCISRLLLGHEWQDNLVYEGNRRGSNCQQRCPGAAQAKTALLVPESYSADGELLH